VDRLIDGFIDSGHVEFMSEFASLYFLSEMNDSLVVVFSRVRQSSESRFDSMQPMTTRALAGIGWCSTVFHTKIARSSRARS